MKITKFVHACLLVEMPDPINRTVLFDPGIFSSPHIAIDDLKYLDDIIITHEHADHLDVKFLKKLVHKFPNARIKTPASLVPKLQSEGIEVTTDSVEGVELFDAPHAEVKPLVPYVDNIGVHYIGKLTNPGDSLHIPETKEILALPVGAPWESAVEAINTAIQLKPQHIIPIHDWHWRDEAREGLYERMEAECEKVGITFHKMKTAQPIVIDALS